MNYAFKKTGIIPVLLVWFLTQANGQDTSLPFERLSVKDGLSQSTVGYIYQDSRGFMWFATSLGLNRFDGYEVVVYKHDPEDSTSISSNNIWHIEEDTSGALWLGTYGGGLNRFDRNTETFQQWTSQPWDSTSLKSNYIISLLVDRTGTLWIGTEDGGLARLDRTDGKFSFASFLHNSQHDQSLPNNTIICIYEDMAGWLWIGTDGGLSRFDRTAGTFRNFVHDSANPKSIGGNHIEGICEDATGNLWIATHGGGLNRFDPASETFTTWRHDPARSNSPGTDKLYSILSDRQGTIWIGTDGAGLDRFDPATQIFAHFTSRRTDPNSISGNEVISLFEDQFGTIWLGTYENGLSMLPRQARTSGGFTTWTDDPFDPDDLSHHKVTSLHEDQTGTIWIGTARGLNRFDRESRIFRHWLRDPATPNGLRDDEITAIASDTAGHIWLGTWGGGVHIFEPQTGRFTPLTSSERTWSLYADRAGRIWHGTDGDGLQQLHPGHGVLASFRHDPGSPASLSNNTVSCLYEDRAGRFWVGTWGGGLNRFDRESGRFTSWNLTNNFIRCLYQDRANRLWIGTTAGLLLVIERTEGLSFQNYTEKDGLPSNMISGILEDDSGNLWISTFGGLSKFNPTAESFQNYDVHDGLQSNEFDIGSYFKSSAEPGKMYFGGSQGITHFHPDSITIDTTIPPIVFTDFQIFNQSVNIGADSPLQKSISEADEIVLSHNDNVFSFEFAALDFTAPDKNQYAYKMEGFNKEWIDSGNHRFATYTNLNSGEYIFRVKGSNHDGIWNEEGISIRIIITPPWWQSWWAYLMYIVVLAGILLGFRRFELSKVRLRNDLKMQRFEAEKLREIDSMKSRFFANISHEFRTPLTLILGPLKKLTVGGSQLTRQNIDIMLRNANRLLRMINQLLDLSKLEAGSLALHARQNNLVRTLKQLVASFESLASDRNIQLSFQAPADPVMIYLDPDKFEKIINNLMSNALKFTPAGGQVSIIVDDTPRDKVMITIADSGIGIPADQLDKIFDRFYQIEDVRGQEQEGSGIGLALTKELVELHGGTIEVASKENRGATFTVTLPLGTRHLRPEQIAGDVESAAAHVDRDAGVPAGERDQPSGAQETTTEIEDKTGADRDILLIVDDNPDMRSYIGEAFAEEFVLLEASEGAAAFEKAAQQLPDLIISDVMMPGMDGFELCRRLKTDERTSHIPIILLTARAGSKITGLQIGADDYVTKPFEAQELVVRVHNLIEQRKKLHRRFVRELGLRPKDIAVTPMDEQFLTRAMQVIEKNISDPEFGPVDFSRQVGLSRMQLHRKLRGLTSQSAGEFIRSLRLKRAAQLLRQHGATVTEVAYEVGFNNLSYFSKCFRELFSKAPSEYLEK